MCSSDLRRRQSSRPNRSRLICMRPKGRTSSPSAAWPAPGAGEGIAAELARRDGRRGHAGAADGGLFDEVGQRQQDLFSARQQLRQRLGRGRLAMEVFHGTGRDFDRFYAEVTSQLTPEQLARRRRLGGAAAAAVGRRRKIHDSSSKWESGGQRRPGRRLENRKFTSK